MKFAKRKKQFINELRKTPIIHAVCNKLGISRNTYYNWRNQYPDFTLEVDEALYEGEQTLNDVAKGNIAKSVAQGDLKSSKYWLDRRHPEFRRPFVGIYPQKESLFLDTDKVKKFEQEWFEHADDKSIEIKEVKSPEIKPSLNDQ